MKIINEDLLSALEFVLLEFCFLPIKQPCSERRREMSLFHLTVHIYC